MAAFAWIWIAIILACETYTYTCAGMSTPYLTPLSSKSVSSCIRTQMGNKIDNVFPFFLFLVSILFFFFFMTY